jgi:hypothetical protein
MLIAGLYYLSRESLRRRSHPRITGASGRARASERRVTTTQVRMTTSVREGEPMSSESRDRREISWPTALLVTVGLLFGTCCLLPHAAFRIRYGRGPLEVDVLRAVKPRMTADEVLAALGPPHEKYTRGDGVESWYYIEDVFMVGWVGVQFDTQGRVIDRWVH